MPAPFAPLSAKPATAAELAALRRRQAASFAGSHHRGQHPHGKRIAALSQTRPQHKTEGNLQAMADRPIRIRPDGAMAGRPNRGERSAQG